jgi:hypothetical protein
LVISERTPSSKTEFYFELDNGEACILSEEGIFFFSYLPAVARNLVRFFPQTVAVAALLAFVPSIYPSFVQSFWTSPAVGFYLYLVFLVLPFLTGKIAAMRRTKKFGGQPLENLMNDEGRKFLRTRREWAEVKEAKIYPHKIAIKWNTSTILSDRGVQLKFINFQYAQVKSLIYSVLDGRLIEKS